MQRTLFPSTLGLMSTKDACLILKSSTVGAFISSLSRVWTCRYGFYITLYILSSYGPKALFSSVDSKCIIASVRVHTTFAFLLQIVKLALKDMNIMWYLQVN